MKRLLRERKYANFCIPTGPHHLTTLSGKITNDFRIVIPVLLNFDTANMVQASDMLLICINLSLFLCVYGSYGKRGVAHRFGVEFLQSADFIR